MKSREEKCYQKNHLRGMKFFTFALALLLVLSLAAGCGGGKEAGSGNRAEPEVQGKSDLGNGWEPEGSMELQYADQFSVDYYPEGFQLITLGDGSRFLLVPEGKEAPKGISKEIHLLYRPIDHIYLAATAAMSLFDGLDALEAIAFSGTQADGWYNENARKAMENGDILYAGKYSEPDYELLLSKGCRLAIESMMMSHAPEVKEKLEELGISVLIDQSSLESHPLGRVEWMKLYGTLLGREELADRLFSEQVSYVNQVTSEENTGKTVAFFHISSSGYAVARKSGDYVSKMIDLAGGNYVFQNLGDPEKATSTVNLEMEEFYTGAKDADYIIYNSSLGGELRSLDELIAKNELLRDFKAVQEGNVWCTTKNMYQDTTDLGQMVMEMHRIFTGEAGEKDSGEPLEFLYPLR